jgi:large subunit ribosomal protein L22
VSTVETPREVRAEAKWVRISPRKARLVAEHIRGRSVPEARAVLAFTSREAARAIEKVLHSAVSNAEANHGIAEDRLYIKAAYVDGGPMLKRWRARARGRVSRIKKRTCHITVLLAEATNGAAPPASAPEPEVAAEETPKPKAARKTSTATKKTGTAARKRKTASTAKKKGAAG